MDLWGIVKSMNKTKKKRNPDHVRRVNRPSQNNEAIEKEIKELLTPAIFSQEAYYRSLGLRDRILNLPVMISCVLTMLWRQVSSTCELVRMLARERLLWARKKEVSQQAMDKRFLNFPSVLFQKVLQEILPHLKKRFESRKRPIPVSIEQAKNSFSKIYATDGSVLEALFRRLEALKDAPPNALAGKICTVIDLVTRLPEQIWYREDAKSHDTNFLEDILSYASKGSLWIFDRGFYDFNFFDQMIDKGANWITRMKSNAVFSVQTVLLDTTFVRDRIILLGDKDPCKHPIRLIEVKKGTTWYQYITSVQDPKILSALCVADLYRRRWRIEETFKTVKRLLGLSYLWTGSENGVMLQVWATFLFFAILVDLGDAVAEELLVPFDRISLEMVFRGMYHFIQAYDKGKAKDIVKYLASPKNRDLGVLKRPRGKSILQFPIGYPINVSATIEMA